MLSKKPWRVEVVLLFCAAQALCILLGAVLTAVLQKMGVSGFKNSEDFGISLVATLSFQGATWILIPIFLRLHGVKFRDAFGLKKDNWWIALLLAAAVIMVVLPIAEVLAQISAELLDKFGWKQHAEEAVTLVTGTKAVWMQIYLGVFTIVLVPVAEEFIFRGVLYAFIKQRGYPKLAFIGVSAIFALIHADATIGLSLFVLALALTWLYEITDNLLAPIAAHSLFNTAGLVLLHFEGPLSQFLQRFHVHLT